MPVLKHAKKKLRQDKVRTERNKKLKDLFKKLVKEARESKNAEVVSKAFSSIDKAAKHHIIPQNKAGHLKSALSKVLSGTEAVAQPAKKIVKKAKKAVKKATTKKK
jgi:small subunit ribosomal protein S20